LSEIIIGLNAHHADSAACILIDGELRAAAEEERFRRIKHWAGFPAEAIRYCLTSAGVSLADVDAIAVNSDPRASLGRKALYALRRRPQPGLLLDRLRNARRRQSVVEELAAAFPAERYDGALHTVEHHLAHLASAFYCGPFDRAVAVSVDGFGDFASGAWGLGAAGRVRVDGRVYFPHSLGIFYQALTQYLGFRAYGDEYKVMGLAPYGRPALVKELRQVVRSREDGGYELDLRYFRHHREKIEYRWSGGYPEIGLLYSPELEQLLGPAREPRGELTDRHRDIAHSIQVCYEDAFFHLLARLHERYGGEAVVIAGGCGMNSVANGKIARRSPFRRCYVQAAAGDAGGAIGAALEVDRRLNQRSGTGRMAHAYWGPSYDAAEIRVLLDSAREKLQREGCAVREIDDPRELCRMTAAAIAGGSVVGWFQGRMEWGPRALGNRSIVCDPRRADMKDILNLKIKRRESFRPFAPSILREHTAAWFEEDADVPFMMQVFQVRPERRAQIPAVTHVDGSGRLQTVQREHNAMYYDLISAFFALTGVPIVLNTSFNENEPVVCHPQQALNCFLRTRMDVLVLGRFFVDRRAGRLPA
jgi:carbamoyltransferase